MARNTLTHSIRVQRTVKLLTTEEYATVFYDRLWCLPLEVRCQILDFMCELGRREILSHYRV